MKSLKNNFFVKTAYSYVNMFFLFFPYILFLFLLPMIFGWPFNSLKTHTDIFNVDLFGLFGKEKYITEINFGSFVFLLIILIVNATIALGIYYGLRRLNKFMKNVFEDKPFIEENGRHLKMIGIIIMVLSTLVFLSKMSSGFLTPLPLAQIVKYLYFIAILISSLFNPYLVTGLVVFVIGEVIVRAAEIKEEQDLTV